MRRFIPLVMLLAMTLFIVSCGGDDEKTPTSSFTYNGHTATTPYGYISHNWDDSGIYEKSVYFSARDYQAMFTTATDYASISLRTNNSALTIPDGTYNFDSSWENFTFYWAEAARDYNWWEETGELNEDVASGKVTVSNGGKKFEYEITFQDGKKMTGAYHGALTEMGN
jgi:hypothetical protein